MDFDNNTSIEDFSLKERVMYGNGGHTDFLVSRTTALIIDYDICNINTSEDSIPYIQITNKQNEYMNRYKYVYRFLAEDKDTINTFLSAKEMNGALRV